MDFSVNINPLGPAPQALEAARAALERAGEYPDPLCRALRQAIAARDGVQPEQVLCGNGAAEVIFRLALALRPGFICCGRMRSLMSRRRSWARSKRLSNSSSSAARIIRRDGSSRLRCWRRF